MLAIPGNCRIEYSLTGININSIYIPSGDTIYQIDTVYHYEIIYDTLFYFDTIPKADTLMVYDTIVEDTDSTVIVKQLLTINVKKNKTIFTSGDYKVPENQKREFDDIEKNTGSENTTRFDLEQDVENAYKGTYKINDNTAENSKRGNPFTYQVRDTIYRFDTVINTETVFDTVFFAASSHSNDTSVTNHVEYQKYGSSVLAKEIVNVKVSKKESIFFEKSTKHSGSGDRKTNSGKNKNLATTTPVRSRKWKRDLKRASHTNRNNISTDYSNYIKAGVSLFYPDITFNAENPEVAANVQLLNEHTNARLSYGAFLKYNYFQKNWGFETGLGFSRQNFDFDHQFQVPKVDTSWYWDYFNKESFLYDTTWYINLDTLLQTGDTLLIPNIDSTMIWLTDSTHKTRFDTSYMAQSKRYNYSFSYLEIPIIGQVSILDGNVFLNLAAGAIPSFLISKSGQILSVETNNMVDTKDISFDYGFSLSLYAAVSLGFKFSDRCAILVEPYYKKNVFSAIRNEQISLSTDRWGIDLSITYRLFSLND